MTHRGSGGVDLERVNTYDQVSWEMAADLGFVISRLMDLANVTWLLMEMRDIRKNIQLYESIQNIDPTPHNNHHHKYQDRCPFLLSCWRSSETFLIYASIKYPRDQKAYLWRIYWKCRKLFRGSTGHLNDLNWSRNNSNWIRHSCIGDLLKIVNKTFIFPAKIIMSGYCNCF